MRLRSIMLLLVVLLVLATPFFTGLYFKRDYLNSVATLNKKNLGMHIEVQDYKLGWLKSTIRVTGTYNAVDSQGAVTPFTITLTDNVTHGPILFDPINQKWTVGLAVIEDNFELPALLSGFVQVDPKQLGIVQIKTVAGFRDNYVAQFYVPPTTIKIPQGSMTWGGFKANADVKMNKDRLEIVSAKMNMTFGEINATNGQHTLVTKPISLDYTVEQLPIGLMSGNAILMIPEIIMQEQNRQNVLKSLNINQKFGLANAESYRVGADLSLAELQWDNFKINPASFKVDIEGIHAGNLANLKKYLTDISQTTTSLTPEQVQSLQDQMISLVTANTVIKENINLQTSLGHFVSEGQVKWNSAITSATDLYGDKLNFSLALRIAVPLFDQIYGLVKDEAMKDPSVAALIGGQPAAGSGANQSVDGGAALPSAVDMKQTMNELIQKGLIIQEANDYVMVITSENGVVKVNGIPMFDTKTMGAPTVAPAQTTAVNQPTQPQVATPN